MKFILPFLVLAIGVASEAKTLTIQCHATWGYQLQATVTDHFLKFISSINKVQSKKLSLIFESSALN